MLKKVLIFFFSGLCFSTLLNAATVLTLEKVRQLALENNRQFQTAQKELDRSHGEIISARSAALPQISIDGRYTRNLTTPQIFPSELGGGNVSFNFPGLNNNDFDLSLSITQPLYSGGKVGSAYGIAKIYEKYTKEKVNEVEDEIVFGAESMFYQAILAGSNLDVLKSAEEQLSYNLDVVEKYFDQGMVSEYELLRARVETQPGAEANCR